MIDKYAVLPERIAKAMMRKIWVVGLPLELNDLINAGWVGLLSAAKSYDPDKGEFPYYARKLIWGEVCGCVRNSSWVYPRRRSGQDYPLSTNFLVEVGRAERANGAGLSGEPL